MSANSIVLTHIDKLYGVELENSQIRKGSAMSEMNVIDDAWLYIQSGKIHSWGSMSELPERSCTHYDVKGGSVLPAWCDSHTHIVYHQSREAEFVMRVKGISYEEIARNGGGILNSALKLREADYEELFDQAHNRLQEVIGYGTGAIEIKSGYGLSYESELKMLRVIQGLKLVSPIPIKASFLGAHAVPTEYKQHRDDYIKLITDRMLPQIADEGLADYMDVFCDEGFFTPDETSVLLEAGARFGLKPKIHANELAISGGVQIGVRHQALSVDHLERIGDEEISVLQNSTTMPTLLPGTAFFLNIPYAPARKMIDSGLPVALATDYNPGSTPSGRMPLILSLACLKMKMLPEEAVHAATINGAYAMELEDTLGSICPGKLAQLIITKPMPSLAFLPYAYGSDLIDRVLLQGKFF